MDQCMHGEVGLCGGARGERRGRRCRMQGSGKAAREACDADALPCSPAGGTFWGSRCSSIAVIDFMRRMAPHRCREDG
jgi:hypothetical protein